MIKSCEGTMANRERLIIVMSSQGQSFLASMLRQLIYAILLLVWDILVILCSHVGHKFMHDFKKLEVVPLMFTFLLMKLLSVWIVLYIDCNVRRIYRLIRHYKPFELLKADFQFSRHRLIFVDFVPGNGRKYCTYIPTHIVCSRTFDTKRNFLKETSHLRHLCF
jgi:hypothetical protein